MNGPVIPRSDWGSLCRLWTLLGPSRPMMLAGIGLRFLQSLALGVAFAIVVAVITGLMAGGAISAEWAWGVTLAMVASLPAQIGFGYLSARLAWLSSFRAAHSLRLTLLRHLGPLPMGFNLSRHNGDSVAAVTSDMQIIDSFMSDALPQIAQSLGLPLAMLGFLALQDWVLALTATVTILLALPLFVLSSQRLARLGLIRQDRQAQASADMIEYVQGLAVIRAFNRTANAESRFHTALTQFRDISITLTVQLVRPMVLVGVVLMLGLPLVIAVGGWRLHIGAINPMVLIAVLVLILSLYAPLMAMLSVMELARLAEAALIRVDRILDAAPLPQPETPRTPQGFALRFEAVDFGYARGSPTLRDVSFAVPER